jgi:hypothetical protein
MIDNHMVQLHCLSLLKSVYYYRVKYKEKEIDKNKKEDESKILEE